MAGHRLAKEYYLVAQILRERFRGYSDPPTVIDFAPNPALARDLFPAMNYVGLPRGFFDAGASRKPKRAVPILLHDWLATDAGLRGDAAILVRVDTKPVSTALFRLARALKPGGFVVVTTRSPETKALAQRYFEKVVEYMPTSYPNTAHAVRRVLVCEHPQNVGVPRAHQAAPAMVS